MVRLPRVCKEPAVPKLLRDVFFGLAASMALGSVALADLENENLLVSVPPGYKVDFQQNNDNARMTEMVPANESVKNWTEMLTVQVFYRLQNVTPGEFKSRMEKLWSSNCSGSQSKLVKTGVEGGYPSTTWVMICPLNRATSKPENTWFRAIQGADSFYVVQKSFKFTPSKAQENQWLAFLQKVLVCDSRLPDRACPTTKSQ